MIRTASVLLLLLPGAAGAAPAGTPRCPITTAQMTHTSTSTERVPRSGLGHDHLTQQVTIANPTGSPVRIQLSLNHRAVQTDFVRDRVIELPPGQETVVVLANVVRPGIRLAELRASTFVFCR